jgi:hypothetical protein
MRPARRGFVLSLILGFCLVCSAQVSSQEWGKVFNPYTGQWEDLNPPDPAPSTPQPETAPVEVLKRSPAPAGAPAEVLPPEPDYTPEEAALQILQHETDEATKWVYERPDCPSLHYHKPLKGKDVCSNPLGDDVAISCPDGATLVTDYHSAGSDACRSARSF